jgi:hypothetical protein
MKSGSKIIVTHEDAGHYAGKHIEGTRSNPKIAEALKQSISEGRMTCAAAHKIAGNLNISLVEVGVNIDLLEIRISKCRLGLFGYGKQKKIVKPAKHIAEKLEKAIKESIADGRISCAACWDAARKAGCSKLDVSGACETLKVKISSCQLGTF